MMNDASGNPRFTLAAWGISLAPSLGAFRRLIAGPAWIVWALLLVMGTAAQPALAQWEIDHWPSNGPPGTVTAPWKPTNPDSTNPLKLGIADAPVKAFTATTLPDGRAAAVFEWIRADGGKPQIFLHVRTLGDKGWADAVPPLKLGDSEAIPRNWKDVKFLMGSVVLSELEARTLPDGRLRIVGVELLGERKGNDRVVRIWDIKDDKWTGKGTWKLAVPGDRAGQEDDSRIRIGPAGEVYWSGLRTCWRKPDADTPKDHEAIMKSPTHPHSGELRCETLVVRRYDMETGKVLVMDYEALPSPFHGVVAVSSTVFWHQAGAPIAGIRELQANALPAQKFGTTLLQWRDGKWQPLKVTEELGLPAGQRPDGLPVWVIPGTGSTDGSHGPPTMAQFVDLDAQGKARREALPEKYMPTMFVRYVDERPFVSVLGHYYRGGKLAGIQVGLAMRGKDGKWAWVGSGAMPPYWRPFHGGHDWILMQRWAVGTDRILRLWQGAMPIHGPLTVSGAWAPRTVLPATQPATRPATPVSVQPAAPMTTIPERP
jgi:hypothetical protein